MARDPNPRRGWGLGKLGTLLWDAKSLSPTDALSKSHCTRRRAACPRSPSISCQTRELGWSMRGEEGKTSESY